MTLSFRPENRELLLRHCEKKQKESEEALFAAFSLEEENSMVHLDEAQLQTRRTELPSGYIPWLALPRSKDVKAGHFEEGQVDLEGCSIQLVKD